MKTQARFGKTLFGAAALVLAAGATSAMAIEEPVYQVKATWGDGMELREYGPVLVAETEVEGSFKEAGSRGFRPLANFIFGNNRSRSEVAMTAPVTQEKAAPSQEIAMTAPVTQEAAGEGTYVIRFTMPSSFTRGTLPEPVDSRVGIRELPARKMAVIRYSGGWGEARYEEHRVKLEREIEARGFRRTGPWVFARYNSPWALWFLRRNEIQAEVTVR